jgi:hypothetical protein
VNNIKNIKRLAELYADLQQVDADIIAMNKLADRVATDEIPVILEFAAPDPEGTSRMDGIATLGGDYYDAMDQFRAAMGISPKQKTPRLQTQLRLKINDIITLQVLGVVLGQRIQQREQIKSEILKLQ